MPWGAIPARWSVGAGVIRRLNEEAAFLLEKYKTAIRTGGIKIEGRLNPFASDINLFPDTVDIVNARIERKIKFPFPKTIPEFMIHWYGGLIRTPGRLYTFVGVKI